jgi:hypothetical protein
MQDLNDILNNKTNIEPTSAGTTSQPITTPRSGMMEVPVGLLDKLQKEIEELKANQEELKQNQNKRDDVIDDEPVVEYMTKLSKYRGNIVLGYNKERRTWTKYDPERREDILMMEIIYLNKDGGEVKEEVDYNRFMEEIEVLEVPVIKKISKPIEQKKGLINVTEVVDYKTVITKNKVMQKVVSSQDSMVVRMPDGSEREFDVNFLNWKQ